MKSARSFKEFEALNGISIEEVLTVFEAVSEAFPMIVAANLTKNTYTMIKDDGFLANDMPSSGKYDDLIDVGVENIHPNYQRAFLDNFSRERLLQMLGQELLMARQTIVVAARAAGIDALDTVYSNLNDMETFRKEVELIHQLGFDGKSIINPRQIEIINEVFTPTQKAIDKALAVIAAIKEAEKKGSGVIAVNGKMVDRPVVIRAQRVIDLALASGVIKQEDIA